MDNLIMQNLERIAKNLNAWMLQDQSMDTVEKVAARAKIGFGTVRRIRKGEINPTLSSLECIANAFGKNLEDLLANPDGEAYKLAHSPSEHQAKFQVREKPTQDVLFAEVVEMLKKMEPTEALGWVSKIITAATQPDTKQEERVSKVLEPNTQEPPELKRPAA